MSAPAKVSEQEIRQALRIWGGNVAASANALGISETGLRKRMQALGLAGRALSFLRASTIHHQPSPTMAANTQPAGLNRPPKSASRNYPRQANSPTLGGMQTAEAENVQAPRPRPVVIRLQPPQVEELRDAKFDYQAKHRVEASEAELLQRFFAECFPEWRKRTCGAGKVKDAK